MRIFLFSAFAIITAAFVPAQALEPTGMLPAAFSGVPSTAQNGLMNLFNRYRHDRAIILADDDPNEMVCCHGRGTECRPPSPIAPDSVQWVSRSDCDQFVYNGYPPKICPAEMCGH